MRVQVVVPTAAAAVTYLLGLFGGFLQRIAPPISSPATDIVGYVSFALLLVVLIVAALASLGKGRVALGIWLVLGLVASAGAYLYGRAYLTQAQTLMYTCQQAGAQRTYLRGDYHPTALEYIGMHPEAKNDPCLLEAELPSNEIWTQDSILRNTGVLQGGYVRLVLCIAVAVFGLTEAITLGGGHSATASSRSNGT